MHSMSSKVDNNHGPLEGILRFIRGSRAGQRKRLKTGGCAMTTEKSYRNAMMSLKILTFGEGLMLHGIIRQPMHWNLWICMHILDNKH